MSLKLSRSTYLVALSIALMAPIARADEKAACVSAYSNAQDLRASSKLIAAQRELRSCARATCPSFIQRDCTQWLEQVEASTPTVVVSAKDGAGHDVTDVSVTLDDTAFLEKLDGLAVAIDPGPHVLTLRHGTDPAITQNVIVRTGEKNRAFDVVFAKPVEPPVEKPIVVVREPLPVEPARHERLIASPLRPLGVVVIGVAVASLLVGGGSGIAAFVNKGQHCAGATCDPGTVSSLSTETTLATVALIAGVVLAATGVTLFVIGKPRHTIVVGTVGGFSVLW